MLENSKNFRKKSDEASIVIIGAGRRVINDFIPALLATNQFILKKIFSRHQKKISCLKKNYNVYPLPLLSDKDLRSCNFLYIAVPPSALRDIFIFLSDKDTSHIELIIDTPIFPWKFRKNISYFGQFKKVFVAEDIIFLPWIKFVKNNIGTINEIIFYKSGFRYHAIALAKILIDSEEINLAYKKKLTKIFNLVNNESVAKISIIEPRDYSVGKIEIFGDQGFLTDEINSPLKNFFPLIRNGKCIGLRIFDKNFKFKKNEIELIGSVSNNATITSLTPELKRLGLMKFLLAIRHSPDSIRNHNAAISDVVIDELIKKFGKWFDISKLLKIYIKLFYTHK